SALKESLDAGYNALLSGKSAIDAVEASVIALEDNILFNAGRGSVFNSEGKHEMDAALMDGSNLMAGAIAGVHNIRNPIELARKVMLNSPHVFMSGRGAMDFAIEQGIELEKEEYFFSQMRFDQWKRTQESDSIILDHSTVGERKNNKFGTVGAVACD